MTESNSTSPSTPRKAQGLMPGFRQLRLVFFRELGALLTLPLYYVLTGIFFLLTSAIYVLLLVQFAAGASPDMTVNVTESVIIPTFHLVHFFLIIQVPLLTMRVFAEDQASGMLDLLQTTPLRDWPLVLGKFFATTAALAVYVILTAAYPFTTSLLGSVEWPVVAGSLLALLLSAGGYAAVGVFFSSVSESQVVASVLTYVTLFLLIFANNIGAGSGIAALDDATRHFAVTEHIEGLLSGNIAPMNVVYFGMLATAFLFLTARMLEARRWRA